MLDLRHILRKKCKDLADKLLMTILSDRAALTEGLIVSFDSPDLPLDALWLTEAENRMAAYRSGEIDAVDAEQVFATLGKRV